MTNVSLSLSLVAAQLVTSAAGLKGLAQQHGQKHLVATSVAGVGGGAVMTASMAGQGTPIQLVGLQMNPGSRNLTATVSTASGVPNQSQQQQQTATIINTQKLPVQRLSCPQLVRTLSGGATTGGTTLKLTQTGGLQVQGANPTTGGIFGELPALLVKRFDAETNKIVCCLHSESVSGLEFDPDDTGTAEAEATAGCSRDGQ